VHIAFELLGIKHFDLYEYEAMLYAFFGKSVAKKILQHYPGKVVTALTILKKDENLMTIRSLYID
jgi:hypothetical protein